jgi:hypothetical protein
LDTSAVGSASHRLSAAASAASAPRSQMLKKGYIEDLKRIR